MRQIKIFSSFALASFKSLSKEEAALVKELKSQGFKLDSTSLIVLNGYLTKKLPEESLYKLSFVCKHKKKVDTCDISGLAWKRSKQ